MVVWCSVGPQLPATTSPPLPSLPVPSQPTLRQTALLLGAAASLILLFALRPAITNLLDYRRLTSTVEHNAARLASSRSQADSNSGKPSAPTPQALVPAIAALAAEHELAVDDLPSARTFSRANASLQLQPVTLRGNAADALNVAYALEHRRQLARIASLSMRRHRDRELRREVLLTDIVLYQAPQSSD